MLKNLLQKVFNFGLREKKNKADETAVDEEHLNIIQRKNSVLSEGRSLLRIADEQIAEKKNDEVLLTLEKIVEIFEREEL